MMWVEIIILALAVPAGYLIAWMARDELVSGKEWFRLLVIASIALAALFWFFGISYISLTLVFIAIASFISLIYKRKG